MKASFIVNLFNSYPKKMNNIKSVFTIKDLENLTGIKAHTIRIWEKRYAVLQPMRTQTNIRVYDGKSLQKLLNINTLNSFGYKISTISKMPEENISAMVKDIMSSKIINDHVISAFKLAMMNFDKQLFMDTYKRLLESKSFLDVFYDCFMPLLEEVGSLWQTNTITPAHEHFISNLIKQKIAVNIESLPPVERHQNDRIYVLYLPENESHELGLMLINYKLQLRGYRTVYLGESIPVENLSAIKEIFSNITFVTYLTTEPATQDINQYIVDVKEMVLNDDTTHLYLFGRNAQEITKTMVSNKVRAFNMIQGFTGQL